MFRSTFRRLLALDDPPERTALGFSIGVFIACLLLKLRASWHLLRVCLASLESPKANSKAVNRRQCPYEKDCPVHYVVNSVVRREHGATKARSHFFAAANPTRGIVAAAARRV